MIALLITLLIVLLIFGVIWYIVDLIPVPPPFNVIAKLIVGVVLLIYLLDMLLGLGGMTLPLLRAPPPR